MDLSKLFNGFKNFIPAETEEGNRKKLMGYIKKDHDQHSH